MEDVYYSGGHNPISYEVFPHPHAFFTIPKYSILFGLVLLQTYPHWFLKNLVSPFRKTLFMFLRQGLSYFVKFDEISAAFSIGLQVHNMKSVTLIRR